jgi:hypothetical protein
MGLEGGSALKRIVLLFVVVALVAAMVLINAVSGFAQEEWLPDESLFDDDTNEPSFHEDYPPFYEDEPPFYEDYPPFYEDEPPFYEDEPPFYEDTEDEPAVEDVPEQTEPLCAPGWLQEWYPDWASGWWYFWWYQYCYTDEDGWYRMYDGWDWGYPMY